MKFLGINRLQEAAGETTGELAHGHDLHAIGPAAGGVHPEHVAGQFCVNNFGAARSHC